MTTPLNVRRRITNPDGTVTQYSYQFFTALFNATGGGTTTLLTQTETGAIGPVSVSQAVSGEVGPVSVSHAHSGDIGPV